MNRQELHKLVEESQGNESNICQICLIRDGKAVYEDNWHGYKTEDAVNVNSVTKGVMSILTGIAMDKGAIESLDCKVLEFFPDYQVKRGEKTIQDVTVRHLITMTAPYKFKSEPWKKVCTSGDWTKAVLDFLGGRKGITGDFKYTTLGIQILAGIIENATGESLIDIANNDLFKPLGIPEHTIHGDSSKEDQFDFLMNKAPRKNEWYSDPTGTVTAGWGICLSATDMAKIGQLVLQRGEYAGRRVVSEGYIDDMIAPHQKLGERFGNMSYGYMWYVPHEGREIYAAIGDGGNLIYVNREEGVSVGVGGTFKPRIFDRVDFVEKYVLSL